MKKLTFGCLLLIPNVNLKKWYGQIGLQLHVPEQEASETVREPPEKHQKRSGSRPNSLRNVPNSLGNGLGQSRSTNVRNRPGAARKAVRNRLGAARTSETVSVRAARKTPERSGSCPKSFRNGLTVSVRAAPSVRNGPGAARKA